MKIHSLFGYGWRIFCPVLVGCALISTRTAHAYQSIRQTTTSFFYQQQQVSGMVRDGSGALAGVTVSVKGKPAVALTDSVGKFSIEALPDDVLVVCYIGYQTLELALNGKAALDIKLTEDTRTLQEVEINAGYYSVTESERTGSISRITSKAIETQPVTNVLAALQGRMAGVNITQTTGVPGGGFDIQIRGRNSLRPDGSNPLYIVDGLPFSSESLGNTQLSGPILPGAGTSPLNNINPSDIESIEILKDADATAIYGSRGAKLVLTAKFPLPSGSKSEK